VVDQAFWSRELSPEEVHLWYLRPESCEDQVLADWHAGLLSPEEREKSRCFVFDKDRRLFVAARALIRSALSHDCGIPPARWRFAPGPQGKPVVAGPQGHPPLRFNLAHTRGLVVAAVARSGQVGVDVEYVAGGVDRTLIETCCCASEAAAIERVSVEDRADAFLALWTLKEAYVKARGIGLALPLQKVVFEVAGQGFSRARLAAVPDDDPAEWQFFQPRDFLPEHRLAVAVSRHRASESEVRLVGPMGLAHPRIAPDPVRSPGR